MMPAPCSDICIGNQRDAIHQAGLAPIQQNQSPAMMQEIAALRTLFQTQVNKVLESQISMQDSLSALQASVSTLHPDIVESVKQHTKGEIEKPCEEIAAVEKSQAPNGNMRLSFTDQAASRRVGRLASMFEANAAHEARMLEHMAAHWVTRTLGNTELLLSAVDSFSLTMVIFNVSAAGIRLDSEDEHSALWIASDGYFCLVFVLELALRLYFRGFQKHFCGDDKIPRWLDASVVLMDVIQLIAELFFTSMGTLSVALLRIIRLNRFVKVLRLMRTKVFSDLIAMMQAIVGGAGVLFWSAVLFIMLVYVGALLCRYSMGNDETENVSRYFDTVPRAMFTVFRCSFGDCSANGGVPIVEHVTEEYGGAYAAIYCIFVFVVSIGLFNVVSAIFVDGALSAASNSAERKALERLADHTLLSTNLSTVVKEVLELKGYDTSKLHEDAHEVSLINVERAVMDEAVQNPAVIQALEKLDIDPRDNGSLSDILDPQHNGKISILDLALGIQRLRGFQRRSDVVSVNLMIRSLQDRVELICQAMDIAH